VNLTFRRNITIKATRQTINAGTKATGKFISLNGRDYVEVTIPEGAEISSGNVLTADLTLKTTRMALFFKAPTMKTLEKWSFDGVAKSVTGKRCEPDGHGNDGSPSWLLALGMI